jgi:hypothetical protein
MIRSSCTFSNDREKEHRNYLLRARLIENLHYLVFEKNTYIYIIYLYIKPYCWLLKWNYYTADIIVIGTMKMAEHFGGNLKHLCIRLVFLSETTCTITGGADDQLILSRNVAVFSVDSATAVVWLCLAPRPMPRQLGSNSTRHRSSSFPRCAGYERAEFVRSRILWSEICIARLSYIGPIPLIVLLTASMVPTISWNREETGLA